MKPTIGWIGLGKMGQPMSGQLLKAGYPVYVYCRSNGEAQIMSAKGARLIQSTVQVIDAVEILFLMVPDDKAIEDIFTSGEGLLSTKLNGKTIVNMSTVSPGINKKMAALCQSRDAFYLEAPVSGSIKQAEDAKLIIMAGGEQAVYQNILPLFQILGSSSELLGEVGSGSIAKLAVNTLLGIEAQGLAEVVNFAQDNGIAAEKIMQVINNGVLGSTLKRLKGELIISDDYSPRFALSQIVKDLKLAKAEGLESPLGNTVYQTFEQAEANYGQKDIIAIKTHLQFNKG